MCVAERYILPVSIAQVTNASITIEWKEKTRKKHVDENEKANYIYNKVRKHCVKTWSIYNVSIYKLCKLVYKQHHLLVQPLLQNTIH